MKINSKNCHGFEVKIKLNGFVSKQTVVGALKELIRSVPASNHGITIFAIVLMAHGTENDWYVTIGVNKFINLRQKYLLTIETNERCLPHKECIHKPLNNSHFKQ